MIVADTTPVNYLILVGCIDALPVLYGEIVVPDAVVAELRSGKAPTAVREWIAHPPKWLNMRTAPGEPEGELSDQLDAGEREAISLARAACGLNSRG